LGKGNLRTVAMTKFATKCVPKDWDEIAPDGSEVRKLLGLVGGDMAHFKLPAGKTSTAEIHPGFEEIWYFLSGSGEMWRKNGDHEESVRVEPGVFITIPKQTIFQFRAFGEEPLTAIGVTMPPWSGVDSVESVEGCWTPSVGHMA
jgi:mannose-6-phosphate isomerase-like protein (cupin superfamily)